MIRIFAILSTAALAFHAVAECHKPARADGTAHTTAAARPVATEVAGKSDCATKTAVEQTSKRDCSKSCASSCADKNSATARRTAAMDDCSKSCETRSTKVARSSTGNNAHANWHARTVAALDNVDLGFDRAIDRARDHLNGARVIGVELEVHGDTPVYEVRLLAGNSIKEVSVDGETGRIVDVDAERAVCRSNPDCEKTAFSCKTAAIAPLEAKQRAIKAMDDFRPVATELTYRGDRQVYAVSLVSDKHWGEVYIDATNGAVLKMQKHCKEFVDSECPALSGRPVDQRAAAKCDVKDCPLAS